MSYSDYRITLDVRKTVASIQINAKKGDTGRRIYITLSDNGSPCEIRDGCYAVLSGKKPDGKLLYNKTIIEDNTIIYDMTQQTTAVAGLVACEVKLFDSMSNLLTSPKLTILVDDVVVSDEEITSKDEVTALAELILDATASRELLNQAISEGRAAAEAANDAAKTAREAAGDADAATNSANAAAKNADAKANAAELAAATANNAAGLVGQSTAAANNAATNANAAAEETNAAREVFLAKAEEALQTVHDTATEDAPAIVCEAVGESIAVADASNRPLKGLTLYGKTTQNGTPTPENPVPLEGVGASGTINTTVCGRNLLDLKQVQASASTPGSLNGAVITDNCIDIVRKTQFDYAVIPVYLIGGKTYTLWCEYEVYDRPADATGNTILTIGFSGVGYNAIEVNKNATGVIVRTYTPTADKRINVNVYANTNSVVPAKVRFQPMVVEGAYTATTIPAFEPYKGQSLTAQTPNGLPGIPVSSDGNYIDENGQQWICDEINFTRGERVHNTEEYIITGDEEWTFSNLQTSSDGNTRFDWNVGGTPAKVVDVLCTHAPHAGANPITGISAWVNSADSLGFRLMLPLSTVDELKAFLKAQYAAGTPVTFKYALAEPIETPLSAEELAQYAALHSNQPNTTAFNDAGAGMKLSYVADTKTYIDQKIAAISAAMLNN